MRILLVSLNRVRFPYPVYPLGVDHVAGAISPPHEVRILDLCPLDPAEIGPALARAVRELQPGAVGLSIRNVDNEDQLSVGAFLDDLRHAVAAVRSATAAPVVLGGSGFTLYAAELMEALRPDYGLVGEGERARALFDAIARGASAERLPGVALPGRPPPPPRPVEGGARAPRAPAGGNPALDFYLQRGGILNLQTRRGCAFQCVYCSYPLIDGRASRATPADAAAAEAKHLEAAGARYLFITDSVFNGDPAHALAVADAFRRARLGIPWSAYFAPLAPPPGFYDRMAEAGCTHVEFGTESLSQAMLRRLRKAFRPEHVLAAHEAARRAGLHVAHFLLLGGPGETAATVDETLDAAEHLDAAALFFFCGMRIHPGTELAVLARAAGQIAPGQNLLAPVFYEPAAISLAAIAERVARRAAGRRGWIVGSGSERAAALQRMYEHGHTGPLWEKLVA
ncbi:B12-binding domain-containing radical SAM protein [Anaeromyxobacter oryzisoli]|uniref:B12-binding domain-containing radical SAM protein n=1 Tax=Anaeromyxobacter oryzisoli TaxID=2925408 RepID=UPI001F56DB06|nr:B12-binding domain-containing radical SAM protein [Anaeromyxobacter sp. SG63]